MGISSPLIALAGPTAVGKTELSLAIAEEFGCEILSVDSMQVYRYMDIGTAKPTRAERQRIVHHLIDIVDPDADYNAACFVRDATVTIEQIRSRGKIPLLAGGTGLYFKSLFEGLFTLPAINPALREEIKSRLRASGVHVLYRELEELDADSAARIHAKDEQRICRALEIYHATGLPWSIHLKKQQKEEPFTNVLFLVLDRDRKELYARIDSRVRAMIAAGLAAEVQGLFARGYGGDLKSMQSIGYRHMVQYLSGKIDLKGVEETMARDTRRYSKRQLTWFRHRRGVQWLQLDEDWGKVFPAITAFLNNQDMK